VPATAWRAASCALLAPALLLLAAPAAHAESAGELRAAARAVGGAVAAQKAGGHFDTAAQRDAVSRLGKLALAYIDLSERTANAGNLGRDRAALRGAYEAVGSPLEQIYDRNNGALERMTKQVMDADGDLEALYDTQPYRDAQLVASQALYFLNWLHYYGALLYDGKTRTDLLEQATRGFSQFVTGDPHSALVTESLLGRGLCQLELGKAEFAVRDLQAVAADPQASPERKTKAQLALLDAYVRGGQVAPALKLSAQLLGGTRRTDNLVRFLRIRALLAAAKTAPAAEAGRDRQQALALMEQLRRAGRDWEEKVSALLATSIAQPEQWAAKASGPFAQWELAKLLAQKGDYQRALPLLEAFVKSRDPQLRDHQGEAQYLVGLATFRGGQYAAAADHLDAALAAPHTSYGADAAYMRFKALEALVAKQSPASPDLTGRYERAIRAYLGEYPNHKFAYEAQFRLGELLQAQRRFADAVQAYARVRGDPGFELRARFATLQCDFELLGAAAPPAGAVQRPALLQAIGRGLQRFARDAAAYAAQRHAGEPVPLADMLAKTALMRAAYATLQPAPDDAAVLEALADFETTYPAEQDLLPQVVRMRLTAEQHLGRFGAAAAEVQAHGPLLVAKLGVPAVEDLATAFLRAGTRHSDGGDAAADRGAEEVALGLYEQLRAAGKGDAGTRLTLARLYENTGALDKAKTLYAGRLQADPHSTAALRGLARVAEAQQQLDSAVGYWQQLGKSARPGDAPWYEANYQVARLTDRLGKRQASCTLLNQLKPAMPGLSDVNLRKKLDALYKQVCG
jgi:tetratricopeptide (TPR) repeat protein